MAKIVIHTDKAPAAIGAYSQAIRAGNTVYVSGQLPINPATGELVSDDFAEQAHQMFKNMQAIIEEAGGNFDNVVKVNAFLTDLSNFATFNSIMAEYFAEPFPARAAIGVAGLPKNAHVEAECIVALD